MIKYFSIVLILCACDPAYSGTVTYLWEPSTGLDGVSGTIKLDIEDLFTIDNWSATSQNVHLLLFDFVGNYQPSKNITGFLEVPASLSSAGEYITASERWYLAYRTDILFQGPRQDLVDTGGIKIAEGTWRLDNYSLDYPAVPIPSSIWLFISGLIGIVGFINNKCHTTNETKRHRLWLKHMLTNKNILG